MHVGMTFEEFVREVSKIPDSKADMHFKSQSGILCDKYDNLIPNYVGRLENLAEDFEHVSNELGLEGVSLPHLHKMKSKNKNYRSYYTEETRRLVEKRYKKDLELFKYSF
jgi:hypothetical protein